MVIDTHEHFQRHHKPKAKDLRSYSVARGVRMHLFIHEAVFIRLESNRDSPYPHPLQKKREAKPRAGAAVTTLCVKLINKG